MDRLYIGWSGEVVYRFEWIGCMEVGVDRLYIGLSG